MKKRRSGALRGLAQVGTRKKPDGSTLGEVLESLGDRSFGWGFVLVGLINMLPLPPGANLFLGLPGIFIASQMALGRPALWLPDLITKRTFSRARWRAGALKALPFARPLSRIMRMRMPGVFRGPAERPLGVLLLAAALVLCLPVPLTGWLPAISLFVAGLGLVEHDGLVVGIGASIAGAAIGVAIFVIAAIWFGLSYAAQ
jgi:hypothetical protein